MNNIKKISGIVAVAIFVVGAVAILVFSDKGAGVQGSNQSGYNLQQTVPTPQTPTGSVVTPVETALKKVPASTPAATSPVSYTRAQVAVHNSSSSCWTVVNSGVYDLTQWISQHPGGAKAILSMCGGDGSEDFNEQHGGDGGPEKVLAGYKIGVVK